MESSNRRQFVICFKEIFPDMKENPIGLLVPKIIDFYRKKYSENFSQDSIPVLFFGNVNYIVAILKKDEFVKITGNTLKEVHEGYLKICREKGINPAGENEFGDDIIEYNFSKLKSFRATKKKINNLAMRLNMKFEVNEEEQKATIEYLEKARKWSKKSEKSDIELRTIAR